MNGQPMVACEETFGLGEGPYWIAHRGILVWVDILAGEVLEGVLDSGSVRVTARHQFGCMVGAVAAADDGTLLVATHDSLVEQHPDGSRQQLAQVIPAGAPRRLNDGSTDPHGRFVVGSLSLGAEPGHEELVRLEPTGELTVLDHDLTLSNGLAWSADGRQMYSVDTLRSTIFVRDYEPATGACGARRVFAHVTDGHPDGIALDTRGHLWVAVWGGGCVARFAADGTELQRIAVPAPHVSCVAFAGDDLRTLVITTATAELSDAQLAAHPSSGRLYTMSTDVPGVPVPAWCRAGRVQQPT